MNIKSLINTDTPSILGKLPADAPPPSMVLPSSQIPDIPAPALASVQGPAPSPLDIRKSQIEADLQKRMNPSHPTSVLGKIGHSFATAGNILGDIFAPGVAGLIPGSQLNNLAMQSRDKSDLASISDLENQQAQRANINAQTAYTQQRPNIEQSKIDQKQTAAQSRLVAALKKNGQTPVFDENGMLVDAPDDPNSEAFKARQIHEDTEKARQSYLQAEEEMKKAGNDPNSPMYKLAKQKADTALGNMNAAALRAQSYYGNYLMHSQGTDLHGNLLNGIGTLDGEGVGTSVQPNVTKAIQGQAQFKDVNVGLQHTGNALQALAQNGESLNSPAMVAALQDAKHSSSQYAQGLVNSTLTPTQRDAVVAIKAMRERLLAMRKTSGSGTANAQLDRMLAMLPGPNTPDLDMAQRQLKEVQSQADILQSGVPQIHHNAGSSESPLGKTSLADGVYQKDGKTFRVAGGNVYAH